jgi:hypothetical protein
MKFDAALQYIAENTMPVVEPVAAEMARPKNPEFEKWKQANPGVPTYKFYKMQRELKKGGQAAASPVSAEPAGASYKELPDTLATKTRIAEILNADPEVTDAEVIDRIMSDAEAGDILNTDPEVIKSEISAVRTGKSSEQGIEEPDVEALKKADLASKYDRMRQALYKARGLKTGPGRKPTPREEPEAGDEEDTGLTGGRISMRDEPIDPNEL